MSNKNHRKNPNNQQKQKPTAQPQPQKPGISPVDFQIHNLSEQIAQQAIKISQLETLLALARDELQQYKTKPKQ